MVKALWLTRIDVDLTNGFHTRGTSAHAHNIVQEVEVHRWLLSGIEELTILCCSFLTIVANK